jgi:hypothetical protein
VHQLQHQLISICTNLNPAAFSTLPGHGAPAVISADQHLNQTKYQQNVPRHQVTVHQLYHQLISI